MKRLSGIITVVFLLSNLATAQPDTLWTSTFGGAQEEYGYCAQPTSDGGFVIIGHTESFGSGSHDVYLIKTDANGTEQWQQVYGGTGEDECYRVFQTPDGGYIMAGRTESFGAGDKDGWLLKTNANGDSMWSQTFGSSEQDEIFDFNTTSDGGFILIGATETSAVTQSDVWLIKTDANGNEQWTQTIEYGGSDEGRGVQQTPDGGYIIVGYVNGGTNQVLIIKTDSGGNETWHRLYDIGMAALPNTIGQSSDNGYIVSGSFMSTSLYDAFVIKTNASGDTAWTYTYSEPGYEMGNDIVEVENNNYILYGLTTSIGAGNSDVLMIKLNSNGNEMWTHTIGTALGESGMRITKLNDGSFIAAGNRESNAGNSEIWLLRFESDTYTPDHQSFDPLEFNLHPAYPNPFNPLTRIYYDLSSANHVVLTIYDVTGREIAQLVDEFQHSGSHLVTFDAANFTSGIYFAQLNAGNHHEVIKLVLLK